MEGKWFMLRTQPTKKRIMRRQGGMTIVEIVVVMTVLGVLFPIFSFILATYRDTYTLSDQVTMNSATKQAMWYMDDKVRVAYSFSATVPSPFTDAYGPHDNGTAGAEAWSYKGDSATSRVLITKSYATTTNALNSGRQPVFMNTPEFNCSDQMHYQPQLPFTTVYFVKENILYRRVLTDTTSALCAGNVQQQKQSCPPYITSGRHSSCQADDEVLLSNVSNFSVAYYQISQAGSSTQIDATYTSNDPEILVEADYAVVTIGTSLRGGTVTNEVMQRMTKVNQE